MSKKTILKAYFRPRELKPMRCVTVLTFNLRSLAVWMSSSPGLVTKAPLDHSSEIWTIQNYLIKCIKIKLYRCCQKNIKFYSTFSLKMQHYHSARPHYQEPSLNMHLFFIIFKDYFFHFICIFYFFQRWNPLKLPDLAPAGLGSSHPWSPALPFPELLHKLCFLGYLHPTFSGHTPVRSWTSPWSDRFSPRNGLPKVYFPNNQKS